VTLCDSIVCHWQIYMDTLAKQKLPDKVNLQWKTGYQNWFC